MQDESGVTLPELLIVMTLSVGVLTALIYAPLRIGDSYSNYSQEVRMNDASQLIQTALHNDLVNHLVVDETTDGFSIGANQYRFTQEGLYRNDIQLSIVEVSYQIDGPLLSITSVKPNAEEVANIDIKIPLTNSSFLKRGE